MFRPNLFVRFLVTFLVIGLLVSAGAALYRTGWTQGYQTALLAAENSSPGGQGAAPQAPFYGYGYPYRYFGPGIGYPMFFFPFGPFLGFGFFLLVFFLIGGMFRLWGGGRWAGPYGQGEWRGGYRPDAERETGEAGPSQPDERKD